MSLEVFLVTIKGQLYYKYLCIFLSFLKDRDGAAQLSFLGTQMVTDTKLKVC